MQFNFMYWVFLVLWRHQARRHGLTGKVNVMTGKAVNRLSHMTGLKTYRLECREWQVRNANRDHEYKCTKKQGGQHVDVRIASLAVRECSNEMRGASTFYVARK